MGARRLTLLTVSLLRSSKNSALIVTAREQTLTYVSAKKVVWSEGLRFNSLGWEGLGFGG